MNGAIGPIAKRYWFADAAALNAIRDAEDAPEWNACDLPVTAFCLDDASYTGLRAVAGEDGDLRIVDARDAACLSDIVSAELERETARYLQCAFHAIEDFGPALDLLRERLEASDAQVVRTDVLAVTPFETRETEALLAERSWIAVRLLREMLAKARFADAAALQAMVAAAADNAGSRQLKLIAGTCYLTQGEYAEPTGADRDAALWRARTARAWSEIERFRSEKRVRSGREAAIKARHERDLAWQAERTRREIDRLYRAAGWAGRWRARFGRLFGK